MQSYCCGLGRRTHDKLKDTFSEILLINSSLKNPYPQDIKELQDFLNTLEIFLKDYVVDVKYLKKLNIRNDVNESPFPNYNQTFPLDQNERELPPIPYNHIQLPVHNLRPYANDYYK